MHVDLFLLQDDFGNPLVQNKVLVGSYLGRLADGPDVFNNIVEWKDWIVAVSYTHLDVYKRQLLVHTAARGRPP